MKDSSHPTFTITLSNKKDEVQEITVQYAETTDGVPFYALKIEENEVQVRKDGDKWELIWGELADGEIESIGSQIDEHIIDKN